MEGGPSRYNDLLITTQYTFFPRRTKIEKTPTAGGKCVYLSVSVYLSVCVCLYIYTRAVAVFRHAFLLLIFCYICSVAHLHRCSLPFSPTHAAVKTKPGFSFSVMIHSDEQDFPPVNNLMEGIQNELLRSDTFICSQNVSTE